MDEKEREREREYVFLLTHRPIYVAKGELKIFSKINYKGRTRAFRCSIMIGQLERPSCLKD
jgi:hypothetical protein